MGAVTAIAVAGVAVAGVSAGASFASAAKQRKLQTEAQRDAEAAMLEAKSKLNVNYYDVLSIYKDPYEYQREALLSQGAQAIEAGKEAERGAASVAGRVQMAQNDAQAIIRASMSKELLEIEKLKATEDSRLRDSSVIIDLQEAKGAQQASADAQAAAARYTQQGFSSLSSMGQQMIQMAPLYSSSGSESTVTPQKIDAPSMEPQPGEPMPTPPNPFVIQ